MLIRRILLWPFSLLYYVIISIRNLLYDKGLFTSKAFPIPIISVGNLKAGGTGKTPHVEYLTKLLMPDFKVGIVSRGYGRKTKGYLLGTNPDPALIGDEPAQYKKKFKESIIVAVGEDRVAAVEKVLNDAARPDVILLDDAFQHRRIKPGFNILLTEYSDPFYEDMILPSGMLRESKQGAGRASAIIVTKCSPQIASNEISHIEAMIRNVAGDKQVFFSFYELGEPVHIFNNSNVQLYKDIIAFAGIANPSHFYDHLDTRYKLHDTKSFPDHFNYNVGDFHKIINNFKRIDIKDKCILTTEKDAVKIASLNIPVDCPVFYVPVKVKFIKDEKAFQEMILDFVRK